MSLQTSVTTEGEAADYSISFDAVYEKVRYMPAAVIPTYGTITSTITIERMRGTDHRVFDASALLTYGASGVPTTLVFDSAVTYDVDVTTGLTTRL